MPVRLFPNMSLSIESEKKVKTELNLKELEQVNGGSFFENAVKYIKEKVEEVKDLIKIKPDPVIAGLV